MVLLFVVFHDAPTNAGCLRTRCSGRPGILRDFKRTIDFVYTLSQLMSPLTFKAMNHTVSRGPLPGPENEYIALWWSLEPIERSHVRPQARGARISNLSLKTTARSHEVTNDCEISISINCKIKRELGSLIECETKYQYPFLFSRTSTSV